MSFTPEQNQAIAILRQVAADLLSASQMPDVVAKIPATAREFKIASEEITEAIRSLLAAPSAIPVSAPTPTNNGLPED